VSPKLRTPLILAAVAIAGFAALATMAERYRRIPPERSVLDLPADAPPPARPVEPVGRVDRVEPAPAVVAPPPSPEVPAPTAPESADAIAVESFLAVRGAMREYVEGSPRAARKVAEIVEKGEVGSNVLPADPRFLGGFRAARMEAIDRAGIGAEEYARLRAAFTAWRKGEGTDGLAAAFAAKGEAAARADLGPLEALDYALSF
jgi:hypothetical protein